MKHDVFSGYVNYRDKEHVFIFNDYNLQLIPLGYDELVENKSRHVFECLTRPKKNGWINDLILQGVCFDDKNVYFCIQDNPGLNNGIFSYRVKWFYISDLKYINEIKINGISFVSQEINNFYSIKKYIKDDFNLENGTYKDYQMEIKSLPPDLLGKFRYSNYGISIYGGMSWKKNYSSNNNFEVWSKLTLQLSRETSNLGILYRLILLQLSVINFLTYRNNNEFDMIETYIFDERKKKVSSGKFYIDNTCIKETEFNNIKHMIKSDNIKDLGKLYKLIIDGKIYLNHICNSFNDRRLYKASRMLGIMISFERIFEWQYGREKIRSKDYIKLLDNIKYYLIDGKEQVCSNIQKKSYFKKILKRCTEPQVDYGSCIKYVINEIPLCKKYIENIYDVKDLNKIIDEISERVNKFRNDMAHGNMDINMSSEHTKDIKLIEIIVYIMVLKYINVDDQEIVNKINWLFNIRCFVS